MKPGTQVRFMLGPLGVLKRKEDARFSPEVVRKGETGEVVEGIALPEGWILVKVTTGYVPVHPNMVEALDAP